MRRSTAVGFVAFALLGFGITLGPGCGGANSPAGAGTGPTPRQVEKEQKKS